MAIIQEAFDIPNNIATGLATGEYRRIGGVVRYAMGPHKGQIVKHLKPVDLNDVEQAKGLGVKALKLIQQHKREFGIAAIGIAVVSAGVYGYTKLKNHEPKVLANFRADLKIYIDAIRNGTMDLAKIENLLDSLTKLKKYRNYKKLRIQLTAEELETLVVKIHEYTIDLANKNSYTIKEKNRNPFAKEKSDVVTDLQKYLKIQKEIFDTAA